MLPCESSSLLDIGYHADIKNLNTDYVPALVEVGNDIRILVVANEYVSR